MKKLKEMQNIGLAIIGTANIVGQELKIATTLYLEFLTS
jgi:hypothetical protein